MKTTMNISTNGPNRGGALLAANRRRAIHMLLALTCAAGAMHVHAQNIAEGDSINDAPWNVLSLPPYAFDPSYANGRYRLDNFAGTNNADYAGKKALTLPNGDIVVAGVVPAYGHLVSVNLGLSLYNASGEHETWANPGVYGIVNDQWIVFPGTSVATGDNDNVSNVADMKLVGNRILVLVDHKATDSVTHTYILAFDTDGQYLGRTIVLHSPTSSSYGGGIAVYSNNQFPETFSVIWVGTAYVGGVARAGFKRGTLQADGTIDFDGLVYPSSDNLCQSTRNCEFNGVAVGGRSGVPGTSPRIYLAGARQFGTGDDRDFLVMQVDSSGEPQSAFAGGDGGEYIVFDDGNDNVDRANAISVDVGGGSGGGDAIFLAGFVDRDCRPGIGITRLEQDGTLSDTFGNNGKLIVGGSNETNPALCFLKSAAYGNATALGGDGRLGIAGSQQRTTLCIPGNPCAEASVDGALAVVDEVSGEVKSFASYSFLDSKTGTRTRHTEFWGLVSSDDGTFLAAGDARELQAAPGEPPGHMVFATARFIDDVIFADGFGGD